MQSRWPWALAATSCAPLILRIAALRAETGSLAPVDAQGFASDLAMASVAAAVLLAANRLHRSVAFLLALLWLAAHYANYETVRVLGAPASLRDAHFFFDPTFVAGSALAFSSPALLAGLVVATGGLAWAATQGRRATGAGWLAGSGFALALLVAAVSESPEEPVWRQLDFLQRDVALAARSLVTGEGDGERSDPPAAMLAAWPELAANLEGVSRLSGDARAKNVLLVVLESVSGLHLESFAREHGRRPDAAMPRLDALAERSLRYVSFVAHQRKTNRGLYTLLCGELPNLLPGTPKMSAAAERPWRVCLPDVLRDAGYHTAYLQAAPLAFMLKDRFLPRAGFDEVHGHDWFQRSNVRSAWGVDDRAFFEQAERRIDELRARGEPWLLTLLNVGTHHPYLVPENFQPGPAGQQPRRSFGRAAAYLDGAFGAFIEGLEAKRLLDDTLLVVTSDESAGFAGFDTEPAFKGLSQSWGFLLLRGPGVPVGVVREPQGLVDLPLSIADYLALGDRAEHFFGRSVLRRYDTSRPLPFGNGNLGSLGTIEASDTLLVCGGSGACRRHEVPGQRYFGVLPDPAPVDENDPAVLRLRDLAKRSEPRGWRRPRSYELLVEPEVHLEDDRPHMLHGGQFLQLAEDEWLEVTYEVELRGTEDAEVELMHSLTGARNAEIIRERARLTRGTRFELHYRYAPDADGERSALQCRTTVRRLAGLDVRLHHSRARMRIRRGGERPEGGLQVDRLETPEENENRPPTARTSRRMPTEASSA